MRPQLRATPTSSMYLAAPPAAQILRRCFAFHLEIESRTHFVLINAMPILQTARLILRPFGENDVDLMAELMANPDFMRFSLGVYSRQQTAAFVEKVIDWQRDGLPSQFALITRSNNTLVGYCGFFHQIVDEIEEIEIGYRLHPAHWNQGLATEAATAVRDHAFRDLKLARVISLIHPDNIASRRVAEKIGMTQEKEAGFRGFPTTVFAISRGVWSANYGA